MKAYGDRVLQVEKGSFDKFVKIVFLGVEKAQISNQIQGGPKATASDHLIREIFSGVCRDSQWFEEYLKIIEIGDHFFQMNVHFSRFQFFNMRGWWIASPFGSSMSRIRDIDQDKSRSSRGIVHTQASLRKHDRVRHLISGVDHPI